MQLPITTKEKVLSANPEIFKPSPNNIIRYFQKDNKDPFTVWIQPKFSTEEDNPKQIKSLNPFKVGRLICKKYHNISYICSKSKSTVEVNLKNLLDANQLIDDPIIAENNLKAFIPSFRLIRRGIIKDIDEDITEEEILENMESEFKILRVRRLNKRNRNSNRQENDPKWLASKSVVITFSGQNLPRDVSLHKIKIEVEPYMILLTTCYN